MERISEHVDHESFPKDSENGSVGQQMNSDK